LLWLECPFQTPVTFIAIVTKFRGGNFMSWIGYEGTSLDYQRHGLSQKWVADKDGFHRFFCLSGTLPHCAVPSAMFWCSKRKALARYQCHTFDINSSFWTWHHINFSSSTTIRNKSLYFINYPISNIPS
jgi:hypothetical protein